MTESNTISITDETKSITIMKKGDYTVHILVEEVQGLEQKVIDKLPKPTVKITCFNESKRTSAVKSGCISYTYEEHFYFQKSNLSAKQLDCSKILIEVYDSSNSKNRKDYFGIYEFDLQYIYSMKNHCLKNNWLALANPESDDLSKVRGYLKVSISVLNDLDPRVELKINDKNKDISFPTQIKKKYKLLSFYIIRAEKLPEMNTSENEKNVNRNCEPIVEIQYMGFTSKTKISKNINDRADFNQILNIPVDIPSPTQKIILQVKDAVDSVGKKTQTIGSYEIELKEIIGEENLYENYKFIDIYGASKNEKGKINDLMNNNPLIASRWNGRLLLKVLCKDIDRPERNIIDIDQDEINYANKLGRDNLWSLKTKLYNAYYLPSKYNSYSLKITCQDNYMLYTEQKTVKQCIEFKTVKNMEILSFAKDKDDLPDIFFYLLNPKGKPVCFQRIPAGSFQLNDQIMIIKLFPEPCYKDIDSNVESGILKAKIVLYNNSEKNKVDLSKFVDGDTDSEDQIEDLEALAKMEYIGIGQKLKPAYSVVVVVYMSRYLESGDSSGTNDPLVKIQCGESVRETSIQYNKLNGVWNEKLIFDCVELNLNKNSTWPVLLTKVYDHDTLSYNDLLGYSYVWLCDSDVKINDTSLADPKWHQLYLPKSNSPQGELLLSFYIFDNDHQSMIGQIQTIPETTPYTFEINILGLRDLKPFSMLPIKKAYINFEMDSLNISGDESESLPSKQTQPKNKGSNPTINDALKFDVNLPKDLKFMPQLQCRIFDYIFSGTIKPNLGCFILNISRLVRKTNLQIYQDLAKSRTDAAKFLKTGSIANDLGAIGKLDKIMQKQQNELSKSDSANLIDIDNKEDEDKKDKDDLIINTSKNREIDETVADLKNEDIETSHRVNLIEDDEKKIDFENEENLNKSENYVILPEYKSYKIPGKKNIKEEFKVEDESKAPPSDYYFPIGYIPKPSDNKEYDKNCILVNKDLTKPNNIMKHYRRIYHTGLEEDRDLNLRSPFTTCMVRRTNTLDKSDANNLFSSLGDGDNKIIKSYKPEDENKSYEERQRLKRKTNDNWRTKRLRGRKTEESEKEKNKNKDEVIPRNFRFSEFGKFKGVIRVTEKEKMDEYKKAIEGFRSQDSGVINQLKNFEKYEKLTKSILVKHEVIIRVYVLEFNDLPSKDLTSESDPYIKIYLGETKYFDEQKNYLNNTNNGKWYKYYDIISEFPGDSTLKIEVWDYDPIFRDEMIGATQIDLEDRYFNNNWLEMKYKPIETRLLFHPDLTRQQGNITLWVEIFDKKDRLNMEAWQISPEPKTTIEMRLIVWETEDMELRDDEGTSDVFVSAYVDPNQAQSTDVHYRCQNGTASFNWRMVYKLELPSRYNKLVLHAYDKDIFSKDDYITGAELDISDMIKIPKNLDVPLVFNTDYVNDVGEFEKNKYKSIEFLSKMSDPDQTKFWIQCYRNNTKSGRILCSLEFLPLWKADNNPVGKGRSDPNEAPYLPPPFGRFEWSLNPFKMLNQCVGPKVRRKLYMTLCIICCTIYLIFLLPYMIYHLSGQLFNPFNYMK